MMGFFDKLVQRRTRCAAVFLCGKRKTKCNYVNFSFFKQRLYFERKLL